MIVSDPIKRSWANSNTLSSGKANLLRHRLLCLFQSVQSTAANSSGSLFPTKMKSSTSIKEEHAESVPWFHSSRVHHKGFMSGQCNKACTTSSWCILHLSPKVLKLGPDRMVRSRKPQTAHFCGSFSLNNRFIEKKL